jgi:hypothetical protein
MFRGKYSALTIYTKTDERVDICISQGQNGGDKPIQDIIHIYMEM